MNGKNASYLESLECCNFKFLALNADIALDYIGRIAVREMIFLSAGAMLRTWNATDMFEASLPLLI